MKLQYQLNAAFTALLLVILAVTGFFIHSLIMDLLVQNEQRQLEQQGEILVNVLNEQYGTGQNKQFSEFLEEQNLQLILYDRAQNAVLFSTMSNQVVKGFIRNNNILDTSGKLWEYGKDKFVTSRILFYPEHTGVELILLTPLNDLRAVQQSFVARLILVFIIGAIAAVILSYFLTNKLVTPLTRLKWQLKKIEKRQFDQIEPIRATGEIKEVAQSVYDMANELQRYIQSQQVFFQNASHELKTPLMTIQGYAEGIKEKVFDAQETDKGLEVIVTEVNRLKTIINEMILLAKLDSEQTAYQPMKLDAAALMKQVTDRALPLINEKNIELKVDVEDQLQLDVDEEKFLRALLNITFNGIRHAHTMVQIHAYKDQQTKQIIIEDDGPGISEAFIPHIFHRFVKGKNGETGLGLAISRAIVEQSNGTIAIGKSELGGAKFTITLRG